MAGTPIADPDVLVVGAGVAGLAAGLRLSAAGRRVVTDRGPGPDRRPGAHRPPSGHESGHRAGRRVHPRTLRLALAADPEAGLSTRLFAERHVGLREGGDDPVPRRARNAGDAARRGARRPGRPAAGRGDRRGGHERGRPRLARRRRELHEGFHAADARRIGLQSLRENEAAEEADGEEVFRIPAGYDTVPNWLRDRCPRALLDLRLSTHAVSHSAGRPGAVTATVGEPGRHRRGDTCGPCRDHPPIGVLKTPADGPAGIRLDPGPPGWSRRAALHRDGRRAPHRASVRGAWWTRAGSRRSALPTDRARPFPVWWASPPGDEPQLTGWCGGPRAFSLAGRTPACSSRPRSIRSGRDLRRPRAERVRTAERRLLPRLGHRSYSPGAYSYGGVGGPEARAALAEPVADTLVTWRAKPWLPQAGTRRRTGPCHRRRGGAVLARSWRPEPAPGGGVSLWIRLTVYRIRDPMGVCRRRGRLVKRHHGHRAPDPLAQRHRPRSAFASGLQIYGAFRHFGPRGEPLPLPNPLDGKPFPDGAASADGSPAGSTGILRWPGLRHHRPASISFSGAERASGARWSSGRATSARDPDAALLPAVPGGPPAAGQAQRAAEGGLHLHRVLGALSALTGFAIYKPVQLAWLTSLFGGYELARYWHFVRGVAVRRLHDAPRRARSRRKVT